MLLYKQFFFTYIIFFLQKFKVFAKTSIIELRQKSILLTGYLEFLIENLLIKNKTEENIFVKIITPRDPNQRGCQLSLHFECDIQKLFNELIKRGIAVSAY